MSEPPSFGIEAVFCDDIRREDNGKMLLIGVYTEGVAVVAFPAGFSISVWLKLTGLPLGDSALSFRLMVNGVQHLTGTAPFQITDATKPLNLFFPGLPINIDRTGRVEVDMSLSNGQAVGVAGFEVTQAEVALLTPPAGSSPSAPG